MALARALQLTSSPALDAATMSLAIMQRLTAPGVPQTQFNLTFIHKLIEFLVFIVGTEQKMHLQPRRPGSPPNGSAVEELSLID